MKVIKRIIFLLLVFLVGCFENENQRKFIPTKYIDDVKHYKLEQKFNSPSNTDFIGIYYDESKSLSGIKVFKLYRKDSTSIAELHYGAHPLEISEWSDSLIIINAGVFSAHGDSAYRRLYLDGSVDKNNSIGKYKLKYNKDYNFRTK